MKYKNTVPLHKVSLFLFISTLVYHTGSKSIALQLGVHLILLYFIRILLLSAETFFLFGGWWMATFWFFKSLDIHMVDTLGVYVYI